MCVVLHPFTVHFPVAGLAFAALLYIIALFREEENWAWAANVLHMIGLAGAIVAFFSGQQAEGEIVHTEQIHSILALHARFALVIIWMYGLLLVWRYLRAKKWAKGERAGFTLIFCVALGILFYSASLGGKLVYEEGAGVEPYKPTLKEMFQKEQEMKYGGSEELE